MNTKVNVATKKALPKLKQLKNSAALHLLGGVGYQSEQCPPSGPTRLPTQVGCGKYGPPAN